jgi:hypothetical protein
VLLGKKCRQSRDESAESGILSRRSEYADTGGGALLDNACCLTLDGQEASRGEGGLVAARTQLHLRAASGMDRSEGSFVYDLHCWVENVTREIDGGVLSRNMFFFAEDDSRRQPPAEGLGVRQGWNNSALRSASAGIAGCGEKTLEPWPVEHTRAVN